MKPKPKSASETPTYKAYRAAWGDGREEDASHPEDVPVPEAHEAHADRYRAGYADGRTRKSKSLHGDG